MNIIGPQVRQIRETQGLTQEELAKQCQAAGWDISRGTFGKIEAQVRRVTDKEAVMLAEALDTDISELFKITDADPTQCI